MPFVLTMVDWNNYEDDGSRSVDEAMSNKATPRMLAVVTDWLLEDALAHWLPIIKKELEEGGSTGVEYEVYDDGHYWFTGKNEYCDHDMLAVVAITQVNGDFNADKHSAPQG